MSATEAKSKCWGNGGACKCNPTYWAGIKGACTKHISEVLGMPAYSFRYHPRFGWLMSRNPILSTTMPK